MIPLLIKNMLLGAGRLLLLSVIIFFLLRTAGTYYDSDLSFISFMKSMFSGRLVRDPGISGLPPLRLALLYSFTTLVAALILSYGFGGPLGVILGRYRMAWTQVLGHFVISIALAVPAFWVAYVGLYYSISEMGIFIGGEAATTQEGASRAFIGKCLLLAIPLSLSGIAYVARQVSQTLFNAFPEGSLRASRSLGITQRNIFDTVAASIIWRPLLRSFPFLCSLFASILIVTETAFFIPGFGYSVFKAAKESDLQSLAVLSLWVTTALIFVNVAVDIMVETLDTRQPTTAETES